MTYLDTLLDRNEHFAARVGSSVAVSPQLPEALPTVKAVIIGCADMRAEPVDILGLKLGEAVVMRNIGGRVTPGLLQQLGLLGRIGQVAGQAPGGGGEFHLIVMQHTDCGITRLVSDAAMLAPYFAIAESKVHEKALLDPREAVAIDVAILRDVPAFPAEWLLSGIVYDVTTGKVEVVVAPAPIRAAA